MGTRTRLLNNVDGDISVGAIVATSITDTSLTAGRVVIVGTGGLLEDDAGLTYDKTTNVLTNTGGGVVITNTGLASATAALTTTGTLSTTNAEQFGVSTTITSAGSGAAALQNAYRITLAAGYTGGAATFGIQAINLVAGTGTGGVVQASANYAIGGSVSVTTTGDNVGVTGSAQGGNKSIGGSFIAATNKAGATNIGVTGLGLNGGGGGAIQIGGYFGLQDSTPTFTSAALMCDNGATTDPSFVVRDNGSSTFTVVDGGFTTVGTSAGTERFTVIAAGTTMARVSDSNTGGSIVLGQDASLGPLVQSHTGSNGNSLVSAPAVRMAFGGSGYIVSTSPSTTVGNARTFTDRFFVTLSGNVGIATSTFGTNATNTLALFNGTVPSTSPADTVQYFSLDVAGAGTASMGLRTEQAVAAEVLADTTHTLIININGTAYKWHLTAV